ncbi:hypothetical protein GGR50DRAFT_245182 [Xylaria sp. CBS 124048]|nr:hypothetical protein GGR50DRAFT_245182 [Xylaria sp. CBS 124048]
MLKSSPTSLSLPLPLRLPDHHASFIIMLPSLLLIHISLTIVVATPSLLCPLTWPIVLSSVVRVFLEIVVFHFPRREWFYITKVFQPPHCISASLLAVSVPAIPAGQIDTIANIAAVVTTLLRLSRYRKYYRRALLIVAALLSSLHFPCHCAVVTANLAVALSPSSSRFPRCRTSFVVPPSTRSPHRRRASLPLRLPHCRIAQPTHLQLRNRYPP